MKQISRRSFLKGAAAGVAAVATMGALPAYAEAAEAGAASHLADLVGAEAIAESSVETALITEFIDEKSYDIVVVGAGTAGVPAIMTALEEGVSVCCLQKAAVALSNGQGSTGIIQEASDRVGVLKWMQMIRARNAYRVNWDLFTFFVENSGETACKIDLWAREAGYPASRHTTAHSVIHGDGTACAMASHGFLHNQELMQRLAALAQTKGADFYYETPGVQLVQDASGAVTGVIGKSEAGYIKFNARKAVIVATGDYQNNTALVERYCPDAALFGRYQSGRTGDGHLLCMQAGARMANVCHAKQIHDPHSCGNYLAAIPLLALDMEGRRFMNEDIAMPQWNEALRKLEQDEPGKFVRVFDSEFESKYANAPALSTIEVYIEGRAPEGFTAEAYEPALINLHCCDTLEALAEELGVDAEAMRQSVARYNALCDSGADEDFGKDAAYMQKIETPPFYGIVQTMRIIAINGGVLVDKHYQALDEDGEPIPGLFAVGTTGGDLCGNVDWSMGSGVSNGHVMTSGRYAALYAVKGDLIPALPASWDDVKAFYTDPGNDTAWSWQRSS